MGYETNERVEDAAIGIIEKCHPHLKGARICYLMRETAGETKLRQGKRMKIAHAEKVSDKMQAADCPYEFIIVINEGIWNKLTLEQQDAVLDHELQHCARDEEGYYIRDHDVEEFRSIIQRHGYYFEALRAFVEVKPNSEPRLPFNLKEGDSITLSDEKGNVLYEQSGKKQTGDIQSALGGIVGKVLRGDDR